MKVLLVDDDQNFRTLFRSILEERGHEVNECSNAEAAAAAWKENDFPLVSLDYKMPETSGLQLCQWMRRQTKNPEAFILMVTAHDSPELLNSILEAKANDYIVKQNFARTITVRLAFIENQIKQITDKQKAEEDTKKSEKRFQILSEKSRDLICTHNQEKIITYVSPSCENILGYSPSEMEGKTLESYCNPEDEEKINFPEQDQIQNGDIQLLIQHRLKKKNGEWAWVETFTQNNTAQHGTDYFTYSRDITQTKEEEDILDALTGVEYKADLSTQLKIYAYKLAEVFKTPLCGVYVHPQNEGQASFVIATDTEKKDIFLEVGNNTPPLEKIISQVEAHTLLPDYPKLQAEKIQSLMVIPVLSINHYNTQIASIILMNKEQTSFTEKAVKLATVSAVQIASTLEKRRY